MKRVQTTARLVAVAAVLAVAGCAGPGVRPDEDGTAGTDRRAAAARDLTAAEEFSVERAEEILIRRCMAKAGFRYWEKPVTSPTQRKGQGYVLLDVAWAKKHGYGEQPRAANNRGAREQPNRTYVKGLSAKDARRYSVALDGDPSAATVTAKLPGGGTVQVARDSCLARSEGRLYGDFPTWFRARKTATAVTSLYVPDLIEDRRFTKALRKWSSCMGKAGHPYRDPSKIRAKLPGLTRGLGAAKAHATEVELAVAEATCATRTSLGTTMRSLDREYREKRLGPYRRELSDYRRMRLTALERARPIVGQRS